MKTLRQFIADNDLNPEDGGLGLAWWRPDDMVYAYSRNIDIATDLHLFTDGTTVCGLLDTATTSVLTSDDDLILENT